MPRPRGRRGETRNRHAHRGGRAAAAPGQRHAGAAQHHRAGKHQLAGQVAPPRPPGRIRPRHAQRAHHPAAHLQVGHEPPVGMYHQPLIQRATHRRRLYAHHSRSDSPQIIPQSCNGASASRVARDRKSAPSARVGMREQQRWVTDQAATISHAPWAPGQAAALGGAMRVGVHQLVQPVSKCQRY